MLAGLLGWRVGGALLCLVTVSWLLVSPTMLRKGCLPSCPCTSESIPALVHCAGPGGRAGSAPRAAVPSATPAACNHTPNCL